MEFLHGIKDILVGIFGPTAVSILFVSIGLIVLYKFLRPVFISIFFGLRGLKDRFVNLLSITEQFQNNHGSSMRDAIDAIHSNVIDIKRDIKIIDGRTTTIMSIIGDNQMSVGMYETDKNGNCIFVNGRWTEITGMSIDDAQSYGWVNSIHPDDREKVQENWDYALRHSSKFDMIYSIINIKTQKTTKVRGYALPIKSTDNSVIRFVGALIVMCEHYCTVCPVHKTTG